MAGWELPELEVQNARKTTFDSRMVRVVVRGFPNQKSPGPTLPVLSQGRCSPTSGSWRRSSKLGQCHALNGMSYGDMATWILWKHQLVDGFSVFFPRSAVCFSNLPIVTNWCRILQPSPQSTWGMTWNSPGKRCLSSANETWLEIPNLGGFRWFEYRKITCK